jgi:hypothetical protein
VSPRAGLDTVGEKCVIPVGNQTAAVQRVAITTELLQLPFATVTMKVMKITYSLSSLSQYLSYVEHNGE